MHSLHQQIATELGVQNQQVNAAVALLDDGATVPFIARYRKEVTGGLDDTQLRNLSTRLSYLRELEERRTTILSSIEQQGKLTPALKAELLAADNKTRLEDLYLPYKPKRRTKGQIAREAGLEPLAESLLADPTQDPETLAADYLNSEQGVTDSKAALEGARYILMERFAEDASLLEKIRRWLQQDAELVSQAAPGKENDPAAAKFKDYFEHREPLKRVPSHRMLAMLRGRNEGVLQLNIDGDGLDENGEARDPRAGSQGELLIAEHVGISQQGRAADNWLGQVARWTWRIKVMLHMETELISELRERAELESINVFASNLKDLLMAAPAGARTTLALDPGLRTGCKIAVVSDTGKLLATDTIYPHPPQKQWDRSLHTLAALCAQHKVELVAIGNGTASRESDKLIGELIKACPQLGLTKIMVSEAGASVYSASELAANEFPTLDVSLRGAVSIGRRLQDPLAELVKIEPKSIGVGQYQHDVNQTQLAQKLDMVIEDCVNAVGVDVNMASAPLLAQVSGLNKTLAQNIVSYRDEIGRFTNRKQLLKVTRLGPKAYEQCAGFLRIRDGETPLDASAVHPEAYPVVKRIAAQHDKALDALIGNSSFLAGLKAADYTDESFGEPTVLDIIRELDKPGRDPRPDFKSATFQEGVETLADLKPSMVLEGVVTNVANFGAFVDIGVHQDGLVHISSLSDKFVDDPRDVVKAGDVVRVKVLDVDIARKRISLTMRLDEKAPDRSASDQGGSRRGRDHGGSQGGYGGGHSRRGQSRGSQRQPEAPGAMGNAFAEAFAKAKRK